MIIAMKMKELKNKIKKCKSFTNGEKSFLIALIVAYQVFEIFCDD